MLVRIGGLSGIGAPLASSTIVLKIVHTSNIFLDYMRLWQQIRNITDNLSSLFPKYVAGSSLKVLI